MCIRNKQTQGLYFNLDPQDLLFPKLKKSWNLKHFWSQAFWIKAIQSIYNKYNKFQPHTMYVYKN